MGCPVKRPSEAGPLFARRRGQILLQYLAVARWTIPRKLLAALIVSGGDGAVDLESAEHAFDAIAVLHARLADEGRSDTPESVQAA